MNNIYRQLKEKFIMKDAFSDWKDYRECLTDIVASYPGKRLAIVGAGRCNDIDVNRLGCSFSGITLIDIDEEAMREGIASLDDKNIEKTEIMRLSVNGLYEEDIDAFCDELLSYVRSEGKKLTDEKYEKKISDMLNILKERMLSNMDKLEDYLTGEDFDIILCNGVFSQLLSMISFFINSVSRSIIDAGIFDAQKATQEIEAYLTQINNELIPAIVNILINSVNKTVIFGNEYSKGGNIEGAYQCIKFIKDSYDTYEKIIRWNFNSKEKTEYDMLIQIVNKDIENLEL
ncbi:MAG: hypothetical protein IJ224_03010 [Lachnospiraceae bacterium]|nr:hypothetical protein [Lachnospiraceae bacterium]